MLEDHGFRSDDPLNFARKSRGVVHVGANSGQEAWVYGMMGKPVLWFEPLPDQFARLKANTARYANQHCVCRALSDQAGQQVRFYVTDNDGLSSSMFAPEKLQDLWGNIEVSRAIEVDTSTLAVELKKVANGERFDALVLDVQGAELKVLQGAGPALKQFRWVLAELSDAVVYQGACSRSEVEAFLAAEGFHVKQDFLKISKPGVGNEWDVLFER